MILASMPNIYTGDMGTAAAFYCDHLGFVQTYRFPRDGRPEHVDLRLGDSQLALSTYVAAADAGVDPSTGNSFELVLWCDDVDREVARLRAAGARVAVEPHDHKAGHRRAYVVDPDGNWLGLGDS
jgi:lactoylglutathione lyase